MQPKREAIRQALRWISEERKAQPERPLSELLETAGQRFDLTPLEQESLITWLSEQRTEGD
jgi:hypothetical protein